MYNRGTHKAFTGIGLQGIKSFWFPSHPTFASGKDSSSPPPFSQASHTLPCSGTSNTLAAKDPLYYLAEELPRLGALHAYSIKGSANAKESQCQGNSHCKGSKQGPSSNMLLHNPKPVGIKGTHFRVSFEDLLGMRQTEAARHGFFVY